MSFIELMAPVGDFPSLHAAVAAGADSIYLGIDKWNMRSRSSTNFQIEDLEEIAAICKKHKIKFYVTLNSIIYDEDIDAIKKICNQLKKFSTSAIIASDIAVITYAHSIGLSVHASTQLNICNFDAVCFYAKYCDTVVLARELTLLQIQEIVQKIQEKNIHGPSGDLLKVEIFAHGALCVAISGKCYMSLAQYNMSANRGACLQACRRKYRVIEEETNKELIIDNQYIMSPKDLCTLPFLEKIVNSGISILKIEGRGKPAEYVYNVIKTYKEALIAIQNKDFTEDKITIGMQTLQKVYNRGFWQGGYYLGKESDAWSRSYGSQATTEKVYVGKILNYYSQKQIVEVKIEAHSIKNNASFYIIGNTTGIIEGKMQNIQHNKTPNIANIGEVISFYYPVKVRKNDKLYLIKERETDVKS